MNLLSGFNLKCLIRILATVAQEDDTTCHQGLQSCQTRQKYVPLHSGRFPYGQSAAKLLTKLTTHAYQKDNHYFSGIGSSCRMRNQEILQHGED